MQGKEADKQEAKAEEENFQGLGGGKKVEGKSSRGRGQSSGMLGALQHGFFAAHDGKHGRDT